MIAGAAASGIPDKSVAGPTAATSFTGNRLIAAILSGIFAGIGYSILFNVDSSTGGTDFIIASIKKENENISFGIIMFLIDSIVIVFSVLVFRELLAFLYGMIYTIVTSIALDFTTKCILKIRKEEIKESDNI